MLSFATQPSDQPLASIEIPFQSSIKQEQPIHQTSFCYVHADWRSLHDFLCDGPSIAIIYQPNDSSPCIKSDMELTSPFFTSACSVAIAHRNHYFYLYKHDKTASNSHSKIETQKKQCSPSACPAEATKERKS